MTPQARSTPAKHRLNPRKLLLSKWTATQPQNREKHFLVTELFCDEEGTVLQIELQAVLNQRCQRLDWRVLENSEQWRMGWK
ncbi:TIGR02450 family Trp-rich protein [Pseudomonas sp. MIL19]|uniref:TIGR02450 family Trp-rich protein n=1 Tax=Pseudomonas sp. MIL19 TaxID=2976979 RepID=UPI0023638137|nr:TIGR02450 family Trp-rich protein [Pseudomonas sp. MIL19]MDD2161327.1 TIGR02450 family Trp-rich protein [Pseudomonas sp. MIL19]